MTMSDANDINVCLWVKTQVQDTISNMDVHTYQEWINMIDLLMLEPLSLMKNATC